MKNLLLISVTILLFLTMPTVLAQKGYSFPDSVKYKKNVIKWNMTPFLLWSYKNINIGYERVLSPYRSFSVNAGYFELPQFTKNIFDSLDIRNTSDRKGFTVSADYRFYFKKRNKGMAPDGLYWGVYGSYHHTTWKTDIVLLRSGSLNADLVFGGKANILSAGVELGYQFIIKDKLAIDLIFMGPSLTGYGFDLTLEGKGEVDPTDEYLQAIYDALKNTIPGFEQLVQDGDVSTSGSNLSMGLGLRYMIQIGYRF